MKIRPPLNSRDEKMVLIFAAGAITIGLVIFGVDKSPVTPSTIRVDAYYCPDLRNLTDHRVQPDFSSMDEFRAWAQTTAQQPSKRGVAL